MNRTATTPLLALVIAMVLAQAAAAYVSPVPSLNASLLYYEPVPASPGSIIDVYVQVANTGTSSAQVSVELLDTYPFSIDTESDRIKQTPSIPGSENFLVKYRVRVDQDADPGTNYVKILYYTDKNTAQTALLPIDIYSSDVSLAIEDIRIEPSIIVPGSIGTITVDVHNDAKLAITDGYVQLIFAGLDIIPYGTTDQQRLSGLAGGVTRTYRFQIIPSPDLEPGVYQVPLILNFTDQRGSRRLLVQTLGLKIGADPAVSVTLDDVSGGTTNGDAELIVRVTNKGLGEIKFATLTFPDGEGYDIGTGSVERYVGNIDSDDYKTARVSLSIEEDTVDVPVTLTYADSFNQPITEELTLTVNRPASSGGGMSPFLIVLILVVVILGLWWVFRRRKAKR